MDFTLSFIKLFLFGLFLAAPILLLLMTYIVLVGQFVGRREGWGRFDALYWSFVTATTLGYGDFRPRRKLTKALSVTMTLVGIIFTGIVVAIALNAATEAFKMHQDAAHFKMQVKHLAD